MKKLAIMIHLSLLIILFGCRGEEVPEEVKGESFMNQLVASEQSLPADFHEIAFVHEFTPYLVQVAKNQDDLNQLWNSYKLTGSIPEVDMASQNVFFMGLTESSSCPKELKDIFVVTDPQALILEFKPSPSVCTSDEVPRNYVFTLDKETSDSFTEITYRRNQFEIQVPVYKE